MEANDLPSDPVDLILMLYGQAETDIEDAKALWQSDRLKARHKIVHAQAIVKDLKHALRPDSGEMANNLERLYDYVEFRLLAVASKAHNQALDDPAGNPQEKMVLDEVLELLRSLSGAMRAASKPI